MAYDNELRGVLFKNDRKTSENHPDFTGKIQINGKEWYLAGWKAQSRDGTKTFLQLRASEPRTRDGGSGGGRKTDDPEPW